MKRYYIYLLFFFFAVACYTKGKDKDVEDEQKTFIEDTELIIPEHAVRFTIFNNHFYIETVIQDTIPAKLILDTGSPNGLDLDSTFVRGKGLIASDYYEGDMNTYEGRAKYIRGRSSLNKQPLTFRLGHLRDTLLHTNTWDLQGLLKHSEADGVLGMAFLEQYIIEINYEKRYIIFHQPKSFEQPVNAIAIPVEYKNRGLFMEIEYNVTDEYQLKEKTRIDIGYGPHSVGFGTYKVRKFHLLDHVKDIVAVEAKQGQGKEAITSFTGKLKSLHIGTLAVDSPKVMLYTSKRGITAANQILLGNYILSRYKRVLFDFGGGKLYIEKA